MKKIKVFLFVLVMLLSLNSLYAVDKKYIPSNSELVLSVNIKNILKKISDENLEILLDALPSDVAESIGYLLSGDFGVSKNDNIELFVFNLESDDNNYVTGLLVGLDDSKKFERFILGNSENIGIEEYENYKSSKFNTEDVILSWNDDIFSLIFVDGYSGLEILSYKNIVEDIFSDNKEMNKKFDIFDKKNKSDLYLLTSINAIYNVLDLEDLLDVIFDVDNMPYTDEDYLTLSLNFNKSDISLKLDSSSYSIDYDQLKLKKSLNKKVYKYIDGNNNLGFVSFSINLKNYYDMLEKTGLDDAMLTSIDDILGDVLDEYGLEFEDIFDMLGGDVFISLWEQEIGEEAFEGMDEETKEQYLMMLGANPIARLNGMGAISINNQEKYQILIDALIEDERLVRDTISDVDIYRTYTDPMINEETGEDLSVLSSVVIYQEGNIVYISPYNNIKIIIGGTYKVKPPKTIKQFADKNMVSLYIDIKNVLNLRGIFTEGLNEEQMYVMRSLSNISIISDVVDSNHSNATLKIQLSGNKGNSINWLMSLLDMF